MAGYSITSILHIIHKLFVWVEILYFVDHFELAAMWIINYVIVYARMLSECKWRVMMSQITYE